MTPVKRKRESSSSSSTGTFPFAQLPNELQDLIIILACQLPPLPAPKSDEPAAPRSRGEIFSNFRSRAPPRNVLDLDRATTLSIALVSRAFHARSITILYANVGISRPSALAMLQRTLATRPLLGTLVKSLYIGPTDTLDHMWWPLMNRMDWDSPGIGPMFTWFPTTLGGRAEERLLPKWCGHRREWPLHPAAARDCREAAIYAAIVAAQREINVDLGHEPYSQSKKKIEKELWTIRMLEVQAALDAYLMNMRRIEDASPDFPDSWRSGAPGDPEHLPPFECRTAVCGHYPPLDIVGTLTPRRRAAAKKGAVLKAQPPFVVSRPQLVQHMFRPGSPLDRFDHPIIFLHSGVTWLKLEGLGRVGEDSSDGRRNYIGKEGHEDPVEGENIDVTLPATASVPALLGLARSVLTFVPNLSNLALAGFLERAVCGQHPSPPLPSLRALSLGPPPPFWNSQKRLKHSALQQVEILRIAGTVLLSDEIVTIAHGFDQLQKIELAMATKLADAFHDFIAGTINVLLASVSPRNAPLLRDDTADGEKHTGATHEANHSRATDGENYQHAETAEEEGVQTHLEVKLHPDDLSSFLARAITPQLQQAMQHGDSLHPWASHRLSLIESPAASRSNYRRGPAGQSDAWQGLYDEARAWWLREAGL